MRWSDPPTLRALDFQGSQWSRFPASFTASARRVLGTDAEAVDEAVNLSLAALAVAIEVLRELVPEMAHASFGEAVRTMRSDPELRGLFKARYATRSAAKRGSEFPGVPTMLTDPFCLESRPQTYWFDAETCERVVCAFIARQTLNRRRALLDVHESGAQYSLRGVFRDDEGAALQLDFLTASDVNYSANGRTTHCRYEVHPRYEHHRSVRKLAGAEVIVSGPPQMVLDLNVETGELIHCFEGYKLTPEGPNSPLVQTALRVRTVPPQEEIVGATHQPSPMPSVVSQYTFSLIKRATGDLRHQVAMNRALTQYFHPDRAARELSGWAQKYERWIASVAGADHRSAASVGALMRAPEDKRPSKQGPRDVRIDGEGAFLNAILAVWLHAQLHVRDLPTDVSTYINANLPKSLLTLSRVTDGKPAWTSWAKNLPNGDEFAPKQLIDSWATVWKLLEIVLQVHNDPLRGKITYSEFVEAMPVKVYANYEAEFEALRRQAPELAEAF